MIGESGGGYLNKSPDPRFEIIKEDNSSGGAADIFVANDMGHRGRTVVLKRFRDKKHWEHYLTRERDGLISMQNYCRDSAIFVYNTDLEQRYVALQYGKSNLWQEGIKDEPLHLMKMYELSCILTKKVADAPKVIRVVDGRKRNLIHRDLKLSNINWGSVAPSKIYMALYLPPSHSRHSAPIPFQWRLECFLCQIVSKRLATARTLKTTRTKSTIFSSQNKHGYNIQDNRDKNSPKNSAWRNRRAGN
ncbi:MAG: hypothetical protein HZA01_08780 [Nitrospinae bacterium]|nr:hypothetical protein [Nitrospinota bacterium]